MIWHGISREQNSRRKRRIKYAVLLTFRLKKKLPNREWIWFGIGTQGCKLGKRRKRIQFFSHCVPTLDSRYHNLKKFISPVIFKLRKIVQTRRKLKSSKNRSITFVYLQIHVAKSFTIFDFFFPLWGPLTAVQPALPAVDNSWRPGEGGPLKRPKTKLKTSKKTKSRPRESPWNH